MHPQLTPYSHCEIKYGDKQQLSSAEDTRSALDTAMVKTIQEIIGALLYYARTFNNKLLVAISAIGAQQASAIKETSDAIKQLLDYISTFPNDGIIYRASNMVLTAHVDTGFHNESKGRGQSGAHIFLS